MLAIFHRRFVRFSICIGRSIPCFWFSADYWFSWKEKRKRKKWLRFQWVGGIAVSIWHAWKWVFICNFFALIFHVRLQSCTLKWNDKTEKRWSMHFKTSEQPFPQIINRLWQSSTILHHFSSTDKLFMLCDWFEEWWT